MSRGKEERESSNDQTLEDTTPAPDYGYEEKSGQEEEEELTSWYEDERDIRFIDHDL